MLRRRVALPLVLGLFGLIWAGAHSLAHDVVTQPAAAHVPEQAVQSYLAYLPTSLALSLTLALAIATGAALGRRWTGSPGRSIWLFGVVPVLGFAADTLIQVPAHGQTTVSGMAVTAAELTPVFLLGLLVQIPFALVTLGVATRILWLAAGLAAVLTIPRGPFGHRATESFPRARTTRAPALLLAGATRSRAPPAAFAS